MLRSEVKLDVPYFSQLANRQSSASSSSCTSLAMAIAYLDAKARQPAEQLADELQEWLEVRGLSRHNPFDLVKAAEACGCKDTFKTDATIESVKEWLSRGNPAIVHGTFTESGHVICLIGYNATGFIVHDPYGKYSESGYDVSVSGAELIYSYEAIEKTCLSDGEFWVHFLSK